MRCLKRMCTNLNFPIKLFQKASDQCAKDPRVQDMLGEPIKAFGEETRRGRRKHVR